MRTSFPSSSVSVEPKFHDFHLVKQNQTLTATFTLKNTSPTPLEVIQVSKSCSCSEATLSDKVIPVGGQVTMTVNWQTRDRIGLTEIPIQVAYQQQNGEGYGVIRCAIRGTVQPKFHIEPRQLVFNNMRTATIQLKPGFEAAPKIHAVKSSDSQLRIEHTQDTVTVTVPEGQPAPERGTLLIFAEGSDNPVCEVRMFQKPE